jgi:hypothetical protein
MKVLGEDTVEGMVGTVVADIVVVVGGEVDVVGWAWDVDTDMDVDMVREDLSGQTDGIRDFTGHARTAARALETEHGVASIQEWVVTIAYSPTTASGAEVEADGGR